jgi:hypothetical protein
MSVNQSFFKTTNYMVPSNGQTHAVVFQGNFSAAPFLVDWRQYAIDNEKFQPQGVFIDNTAGTVPIQIQVLPCTPQRWTSTNCGHGEHQYFECHTGRSHWD